MGREIIRQIERAVEKSRRQQSMSSQLAASDKHVLAIFDATLANLEPSLQQLGSCVRNGYLIKVILSDLAYKLLDVDRIKAVCGAANVLTSSEINNLRFFIDGFRVLVIPVLSAPLASKLVLGITDTVCPFLILQAILRGDTVIAVSDLDQKSAGVASAASLLELSGRYIKELSDFGIQFVRTEDISQAICGYESLRIHNGDAACGTEVISASFIDDLAPTVRELIHVNSAVITPLARDLAHQRGIKLVAKTES